MWLTGGFQSCQYSRADYGFLCSVMEKRHGYGTEYAED